MWPTTRVTSVGHIRMHYLKKKKLWLPPVQFGSRFYILRHTSRSKKKKILLQCSISSGSRHVARWRTEELWLGLRGKHCTTLGERNPVKLEQPCCRCKTRINNLLLTRVEKDTSFDFSPQVCLKKHWTGTNRAPLKRCVCSYFTWTVQTWQEKPLRRGFSSPEEDAKENTRENLRSFEICARVPILRRCVRSPPAAPRTSSSSHVFKPNQTTSTLMRTAGVSFVLPQNGPQILLKLPGWALCFFLFFLSVATLLLARIS